MTRRPLRIHAFAKINLTLRVLGRRSDGYHALRTVFQSVALRDTLVLQPTALPFSLVVTDPACPADDRNLVWQAADLLWRESGRRGAPHGVSARLTKRIPIESGLGGGSSDAAAALRGFARLWGVRLSGHRLREIAATLGADVPYFLSGGTMLGVERGDRLFALDDIRPMWVVIALPAFGVSTRDAFRWLDEGDRKEAAEPKPVVSFADLPSSELGNDLQAPVAAHHPEIGRIVRALARRADYAAMSGSGSAVFGLFASRSAAADASARIGGAGRRIVLTRTLSRGDFHALSTPK